MTVPLLTGVALLQDIVLARVSILGGRPDLVLLSVVAWATLRGSAEGIVWGFIGGLLLDLFSGGPMGGITLALLVVALLAGRQWGRELGPTSLRVFLVTLGLCFLYHVLLLLILTGTGRSVDWVYGLARVAAPSAVLNGALAPLVHYLFSILDRRTRPEGLTFDGA